VGPITGGVLLEHFWWGSIFMVNVPITIAGLILGYLLVPESRDPHQGPLDPAGALLSIVALGSILWAVIEGPDRGWGSGAVVACFVVGGVLLAVFLLWERHSRHPMLDLAFFENPRFSAASGAITLVFLALFGTLFLLTQYLQSVLGYSTIEAGAVLLPQAGLMMVLSPLSNVWVQRWGNKLVVATGLGFVTIAMLLFTTFEPGSSALHVIGVSLVLALGMSNVIAPCTDSIMGSLPRAKAGVGSAVNDTTRQMGGAVGVAAFGSILASHFGSTMRDRLADLPGPLLDGVSDNVGQTIAVAHQPDVAPGVRDRIVDAANHAFVGGLHSVGIAAAVVTLVAAIGVAAFLPARVRAEDAVPGSTDAEDAAAEEEAEAERAAALVDGDGGAEGEGGDGEPGSVGALGAEPA
jgi:EmrB/QacA subfamily drug resistance transporter